MQANPNATLYLGVGGGEALSTEAFFSDHHTDSYLCDYRMTSYDMKVSPVCEAAIPLGVWASILIGVLHTWPGKDFVSWGMDSTSPSPVALSPFSHRVRHSSDTDHSDKWIFWGSLFSCISFCFIMCAGRITQQLHNKWNSWITKATKTTCYDRH